MLRVVYTLSKVHTTPRVHTTPKKFFSHRNEAVVDAVRYLLNYTDTRVAGRIIYGSRPVSSNRNCNYVLCRDVSIGSNLNGLNEQDENKMVKIM